MHIPASATCLRLILASLLLGAATNAQQLTASQKSLKSIAGVYFFVDKFGDVERYGVNLDDLTSSVALRFRQAGIRVYTKQEWERDSRLPTFYVQVSAYKSSYGPFCAFHVKADLFQEVRIPQIDLQTAASTWNKDTVATSGPEFVGEGIKSDVGKLVDLFIRDFLVANDKR